MWVTDRDPNAPALALADHPLHIDFATPEDIVPLGVHGFDGVTTAASDAAMPSVVAFAHAWGLSAVSPDALRVCRDKFETSAALRSAGLYAPATYLVDWGTSPLTRLTEVGGFPFVIKPRFGAGGRGVSIVAKPSDIEPALAKTRAYTTDASGFLVQEFLRGLSVGVEAFFWKGQLVRGFCLGDQYRDDFVSPVGHSLPAAISPPIEASILEQIDSIAGVLGIENGPVNFDLRFADGFVRLIEANARLGGNAITPIVRAAFGVDLSEATILAALGADPSGILRSQRPARATATRLFLVKGRGVLRRVAALESPAGDPRIATFDVLDEGAPLSMRVDDFAIIGGCLVYGESEAEAVALAADCARKVESAMVASDGE